MCFPFVLNPNSHNPLKCHPATHVDASLAIVAVDSGGVGCSREGRQGGKPSAPPPRHGSRLPVPGEGHRWPSCRRSLPQDPNHRPAAPAPTALSSVSGPCAEASPTNKSHHFSLTFSLSCFLFFFSPPPPQRRERQPQAPLRGRDITAQVTTAQPMGQGRELASCIL